MPILTATPVKLIIGIVLTTTGLLYVLSSTGKVASQSDVVLQIGVVQRFGSKPTDRLTLQPQAGDRLTLKFQTGGKDEIITGTEVKFDLVMQPVTPARVEERVVLSTHRSFESAEDNANRWRSQGIPVEVAQPDRWQVWARRDVYKTPLLRRLLLQSIQAQGTPTVYLDSKVLAQYPQASFVVNGYRYARDFVEISASQGIIQVGTEAERNGRFYGGNLRLQPNAYGNYTLVNQVALETYLRGVVPHEIGTTAQPAVLEVQAILARTYVLRNLRRFAIDGYQLCADTQCQVYNGLTGTAASTDRAIAATQGQVLTYQNELVDALYSSSTGGVTAPFNDIWYGANRPYLQAKIDSVNPKWDLSRQSLADEKNFRAFISQRQGFNEEREELFRWRSEGLLADLNQDLRRYLNRLRSPLAGFQTIRKLEVTQRSAAGRVLKLTATTDAGKVELEKDDVLNAFEPPNSTLFYLEPLYTRDRSLVGYAFVGGGFGHGVGLSQTGTYHLGKLGWSSDRILNFYFPATQLQPINNQITLWREPQAVD